MALGSLKLQQRPSQQVSGATLVNAGSVRFVESVSPLSAVYSVSPISPPIALSAQNSTSLRAVALGYSCGEVTLAVGPANTLSHETCRITWQVSADFVRL